VTHKLFDRPQFQLLEKLKICWCSC